MYICIDFDGTIVDHAFPSIGKPVPGAVEWLRRINVLGGKLILFTMRSDGQPYGNVLTHAVDYLKANGVELFAVNHNPEQKQWTTSPKVYGQIYIDDAAAGCPLIHPKGFARPCVDWSRIGPYVEAALTPEPGTEEPAATWTTGPLTQKQPSRDMVKKKDSVLLKATRDFGTITIKDT